MATVRVLAVSLSLGVATVILGGCGSSSNPTSNSSSSTTTSSTTKGHPSDSSPTHPKGPVNCTESLKRGHCTSCYYDESGYGCKVCSPPYQLNAAASPENPDEYCTYDCSTWKEPARPARPQTDPTLHNGVEWPKRCIPESSSHFFTIGDWGGMCDWDGKRCKKDKVLTTPCARYTGGALPGEVCPMPNPPTRSYNHWEGQIQQHVSKSMQKTYDDLESAGTPPHFILNVGDNFYPGGIDVHCGDGNASAVIVREQFKQVWKDVYPGKLTTEIPWYSVLGNHDYGGACYVKGWDQQILYTWDDQNWVMPGQYWRQKIQYKTFSIEMWFIDGNIVDTNNPADAGHDLCQDSTGVNGYCTTNDFPPRATPSQGESCGVAGPPSANTCRGWFDTLWGNIAKDLKDQLPKSEADWQFIISHYPATYTLGRGNDVIVWKDFLDPMGVDLYVSGHKHTQEVYTSDHPDASHRMGRTPWVITGGGGGITTDGSTHESGKDNAYGFMDVEMTLQSLTIKAYSWKGILMSTTTTKPVPRASYRELMSLGVVDQNLVDYIF